MVPDKFNMVDMGGIDLIMMQGEAVPGLYEKLMAAISNCQYQCLYNWLFDGVLIPPTYVQLTDNDGEIYLNEGVSVTSDDVIHIYSVEPAPPDPEIIPLLAEENGTYTVPTGKDGFNPVTVDVPSYTPVIDTITITENGTYTAPSGIDGYSPVTVNVSGRPGELVSPAYQGVSCGYVVRNGQEFWSYPNQAWYLSAFEVQANHKYAIYIGETVGIRRRASFFAGKTIADFMPYIMQGSTETSIYTGGIWLAPFTQNVDDTGDALTGRIIYTPQSNGIILYISDFNSGGSPAITPAYCIDMSA